MQLREIEELDRLSRMLDSRFRVPGTRIRFGWDALLGLLPGLGDVAALGPSVYLIYQGHRLGARRLTLIRMTANTALDFFIGSVPVVGDVFDLAFKANLRNVALLRKDLSGAVPPRT
ncbi:MAG: DUF4112 domain-containing protein [Pseudomonadota bacterium]